MTHRRTTPSKAELLARMLHLRPRPRLTPQQVARLSMAHNVNFGAIADGTATTGILWDYVETVLTWLKAAALSGIGLAEMSLQADLATRLVERFSRTGRIAFDPDDLAIAREGVLVMDRLAELVDEPAAMAAAQWALDEMTTIAQRHHALRPSQPKTAAPEAQAGAT